MADGISIITSIPAAPPSPVNSSVQADAAVTHVSTPASPASFENPRVLQDPVAGQITEYLSANGNTVVSQTPNAIAVAYLREGLEADGTKKPSVTTSA